MFSFQKLFQQKCQKIQNQWLTLLLRVSLLRSVSLRLSSSLTPSSARRRHKNISFSRKKTSFCSSLFECFIHSERRPETARCGWFNGPFFRSFLPKFSRIFRLFHPFSWTKLDEGRWENVQFPIRFCAKSGRMKLKKSKKGSKKRGEMFEHLSGFQSVTHAFSAFSDARKPSNFLSKNLFFQIFDWKCHRKFENLNILSDRNTFLKTILKS